MDKKETLILKLYLLINMDNLPVSIVDDNDHENSLMDLAIECRRVIDGLSTEEQEIFNEDNENIIKRIAKKINLL